ENLSKILNGAEDTPGALEVYDKVSARYENGLEDYGSVRRAREKVLQLQEEINARRAILEELLNRDENLHAKLSKDLEEVDKQFPLTPEAEKAFTKAVEGSPRMWARDDVFTLEDLSKEGLRGLVRHARENSIELTIAKLAMNGAEREMDEGVYAWKGDSEYTRLIDGRKKVEGEMTEWLEKQPSKGFPIFGWGKEDPVEFAKTKKEKLNSLMNQEASLNGNIAVRRAMVARALIINNILESQDRIKTLEARARELEKEYKAISSQKAPEGKGVKVRKASEFDKTIKGMEPILEEQERLNACLADEKAALKGYDSELGILEKIIAEDESTHGWWSPTKKAIRAELSKTKEARKSLRREMRVIQCSEFDLKKEIPGFNFTRFIRVDKFTIGGDFDGNFTFGIEGRLFKEYKGALDLKAQRLFAQRLALSQTSNNVMSGAVRTLVDFKKWYHGVKRQEPVIEESERRVNYFQNRYDQIEGQVGDKDRENVKKSLENEKVNLEERRLKHEIARQNYERALRALKEALGMDVSKYEDSDGYFEGIVYLKEPGSKDKAVNIAGIHDGVRLGSLALFDKTGDEEFAKAVEGIYKDAADGYDT
ncbi:MAG: hypothetical protein PHE61_05270, partial [Candidatus Omnitrophica bacterium]|nr:hypothetical protein [Candidatus Omnitrophota bacterium]